MVTYVTPTAPYFGQDAPLSALQHDSNVKNHDDRIAALEAAIAAGNAVTNITSTGNIVTFHMSNGPPFDIAFELPEFNPRGEWMNGTNYAYPDLVSRAGLGVFLVKVPHVTPPAPAPFDPAAIDSEDTDGDPELIYHLLVPLQNLNGVMRYKGDYASGASYNEDDVFRAPPLGTYRVNIAHISAATFDPNAVEDDTDSTDPLYVQIAPPPFAARVEVTSTTYELSLADVGRYLIFSNAAGCAVTFPDDVAFPDDVEIHLEQASEGPISFVPASTDVTILPQRKDFETTSNYEGAAFTAKHRTAGTWKLIGPPGDPIDTDD